MIDATLAGLGAVLLGMFILHFVQRFVPKLPRPLLHVPTAALTGIVTGTIGFFLSWIGHAHQWVFAVGSFGGALILVIMAHWFTTTPSD